MVSSGAIEHKQNIRTVGGPETLRWLDEDILKETREAITEQLRTDKSEDGNSRVLMRGFKGLLLVGFSA